MTVPKAHIGPANIEDNIPTVPTRYDPAADILAELPL